MRDDERACLECDCECVSLIGRKSIAEYWAPNLETKLITAFPLEVDYLINFRFSPSDKILHTSCGPVARCNAY
jgi:hypothetical protein